MGYKEDASLADFGLGAATKMPPHFLNQNSKAGHVCLDDKRLSRYTATKCRKSNIHIKHEKQVVKRHSFALDLPQRASPLDSSDGSQLFVPSTL